MDSSTTSAKGQEAFVNSVIDILNQFTAKMNSKFEKLEELRENVSELRKSIAPKSGTVAERKLSDSQETDVAENPPTLLEKKDSHDNELNLTALLSTKPRNSDPNRRKTLTERVVDFQEESAQLEKSVIRVVNVDYSDLPFLKSLTHPN